VLISDRHGGKLTADGGSSTRLTGVIEVNDPGPTAGVYTISVAAELAGVTDRSLRLYERHELLRPSRTTGGTRRYSQDDLRRLRRITELIADGVNLTGIGKILDLEQDTKELRSDNTALRADNTRLQVDRDQQPRPERPEKESEPIQRRSPSRRARPITTANSPPDRADQARPASAAPDERHHDYAQHPAG